MTDEPVRFRKNACAALGFAKIADPGLGNARPKTGPKSLAPWLGNRPKSRLVCNPLIQNQIEGGIVLKTCCFSGARYETIGALFPPETEPTGLG
jgi:hypothetical protein